MPSQPVELITTSVRIVFPDGTEKATNTITIRADACTGDSKQHDTPCQHCGGLPSTNKFHDFVDQALTTNVSEFTNSE
jgi:phage terminase large subunit GpA-like protein